MLQTITPEYAALNRHLHGSTTEPYGGGGFRFSDMVAGLRAQTDSETVLDYGCGKGTLGNALGRPDWLREYDPAVDGKEAKPDRADIVVCTDVLEHIEPDLLDNVLSHIADLASKAALLVISTVPAIKTLADGRNAHLIVRPAAWWKEKLEKYFLVSSWNATAHEIVAVGATVRQINDLVAQSAVSETLRFENSLRNCGLVKERVREAPRHERRVAIVCYGPSLAHTWRTLHAERKLFGAMIVSVSGAHDFLIERGIVPDIHIECDPREHKAFFTRNPHPDVTYWIASCCHPKLIDQLASQKLALWHVYNSETDKGIIAPDGPDPDNFLLAGAGTVGSRAVNLMYVAGYRIFSVYGMDCSFANDGLQHAGVHSGKQQHEIPIRIGNRWFKSSGNLAYTARGFMDNMRVLSQASEAKGEPFIDGTTVRVEMFLHGDGLLQEMYQQAAQQQAKDAA
jgi:hypothetical protein